jgi:hypothetical protein
MGETAAKSEKQKAGHYEVIGETYAKVEFFEHHWNPYSRFLDHDKVDLLLRRMIDGMPVYREVQVKFGKLYTVGPAWERALFDVTSWRFFRPNEFDKALPGLFLAYVLSEDAGYHGDIFIFPIRDFSALIARAPVAGPNHRVYISRCKDNPSRWVLRCQSKFTEINNETAADVSRYRRAFHLLEPGT